MPAEFGTFILEGDRFNRVGMPLDALAELITYREIVLAVSKLLWRRQNHKTRTPNGLDAALDLRLTEVREGSAAPVLLRRPDIHEENLFGSDGWDELFDSGRAEVERTLKAVADGNALPEDFDEQLCGLFARFGKTLQEGEALRLGAPDDPAPTTRLTPVLHRRLVELDAAADSTKTTSVVGAIVAINSMHQFCVIDTGQRQIQCGYDMGVARTIRQSLADEETLLPKVALSGTATLRRGGGIASFQRITQIAAAGDDAQEVIVEKLQLLRELTDGWAGPGSVAVAERSIEQFEEFLRVLGGRATDELEPLGLADGGIRLEWQRFGTEYIAEVEPLGAMYLCRLPPDPQGDLDESWEGPFDPLGLARFFRDGEFGDA